jgi:hypothetical protein
MSLAAFCSQALDAQVRYYGALGRLAARAARSVAAGVVQVSLPPSGNTPAPAAPSSPPAVMLLESESGSCAVGLFLVENHLGQTVSAPIAPSAFVDAEGREVQPRLAFSPQVVHLQPGEQALVRVAAAFDERLRPGVRYLGTISVPGVSSASVGVVLRRREPPAALTPAT